MGSEKPSTFGAVPACLGCRQYAKIADKSSVSDNTQYKHGTARDAERFHAMQSLHMALTHLGDDGQYRKKLLEAVGACEQCSQGIGGEPYRGAIAELFGALKEASRK